MSASEIIALIIDAGILAAVLWYAWIANEQRKITVEALELQKDVRQDDLEAKNLRFELGRWLADPPRHTVQLTNRGPDILGWSVTPVEILDAIWMVSPASDDLWKSGDSRTLIFNRTEVKAVVETGFWFRISYRTGIDRDPTTKCFRVTRSGVVPETCPESEHFYVA